jgi:3'-5' exoribonuclease
MKDIYIADLAQFDEGKTFDGFFLVLCPSSSAPPRTNKPYLNLILGDKTGQLEGRVWELGDPRIAKDFDRGDIVKARGSASRFDDRLQMKIDQLRVALPAKPTRPTCCPRPPTTWPRSGASFEGFVDSLANPDLKRLLTTMLDDPRWPRPIAKRPPPSSSTTPGWAGCWSTSSACCTLADRVAPHYPMLDRDLVITGVILHDIGKVRELSWEIGFEYTIEGALLGHIQMGVALPRRPSTACRISRPRLKTLVLHMILSRTTASSSSARPSCP